MSAHLRFSIFVLAPLALVLAISVAADAAPFTPGNVVVYRVGDGASNLNNRGEAVFMDEYTSAGVLVQSLAIPTSGPEQLISAGRSTSAGLLSQSTNGQYLLITGFDAALGGTVNLPNSSSSAINRVIGRIDLATGTYTRTNALSDYADAGNPTGIASVDGNSFWVAGTTGGARYVANPGDTTSTQLATTPTNVHGLGIYNGQLYATVNATNARVATVGTGLPTTSGQSVDSLPGVPTTGATPDGFYLADLDAGVAGVDTLYVAYDGNKGVTKYSLVGGTWVSNGKIGTVADEFRGLTASTNGSSVTLFTTRLGGNDADGGGELLTLTDTTGYNGAFTGSFTLLATAGSQTAFRGVAYIAAIPEPGTLLLVGSVAALCGVGCFFSRKRLR